MKVLDCTLRDGGYINDWLFSDKEITTVLNALEDSKIDVVECGYLNTKKGQ
ncbi:MAG TPA: homocitrate synthase, partial [Sulfurovum sp.]|nr:homocitrate synthase [Sulfurovum sp.]